MPLAQAGQRIDLKQSDGTITTLGGVGSAANVIISGSSGASALTDNMANPTVAGTAAYLMCFDGATWDRCLGGLTDTDDANVAFSQVPSMTLNLNYMSNGSNWIRLFGDATLGLKVDSEITTPAALADATANPTVGAVGAHVMCWNGTTWDRCRGGATDTDDNSVAFSQSTTVVIAENHVSDGSSWVRKRATSAATGAAPPGNAEYIAGLGSGATGGFLTAPTVCDSYANINIVTATTTLIVTGVSGRHVRICSLSMITTLANNVAFISGTGATCGTGTTGMTGGTTSGTGYILPAAGTINYGSGVGAINQTNATGDSVCIITSVATQLSGRIAYAIY
jgi:catabolite regulation protein CreA